MQLILIILVVLMVGQPVLIDVFAIPGSPFERQFGDVKFLDAYFGTAEEKIEVEPGDKNVPFTVVFANVGTVDITGIKGQLSLPIGFSSYDGVGALILADNEASAIAGDVITLTFFVNIDKGTQIKQHQGTVKVDFSRIRESGVRNAFFDFNFKVTGDSIINIRALDPFLTSLQVNHVVIEISNDGTAPLSSVDIELQNTQSTISSTTQSVTNIENVVLLDSNWDVGHIDPGTSKFLEVDVYIPASLKGVTLRAPMDITYFNAHGDRHTVSRIVDFYIKGLIDISIYNIRVIDLSGKQIVIGEIINEGNEDALFGFITLEPLGDSNLKKSTQFIDEIETDSPVPFNIPIEFEGEPKFGEHDIQIIVRYKDSIRDEIFVTHDATIFIDNLSESEKSDLDFSQLIILGAIAGIAGLSYTALRKRKIRIAKQAS